MSRDLLNNSRDIYSELLEMGNTEYGISALIAEIDAVASAKKGFRNEVLNKAACKLGSLVASGQLVQDTVEGNLVQACHLNGLTGDDGGMASVKATIRSGLTKGLQSPRYPANHNAAISPPKGLTLTPASNIKPEKIDWLWEGVLARGAISILAGDPGLGKSQVSLSIAAAISSGGCWPASKQQAAQSNVIIVSMEDNASYTIVPRLIACGADLGRVHVLIAEDDSFNLERDIPKLRGLIDSLKSVDLIIIDPVTAYMGKSDASSSTDVRRITTELAALAQDHGSSILLVSHLNKRQDGAATYRVLGSVSWMGAARTAFFIERDSGDAERRVMVPAKNNLALDTTGFAFALQSVDLPDGIKTSRVIWDASSHTGTADQVLVDRGDGGDALALAVDFLRELLKSGRVESMKANKAANDNQISESTLKRAKRKLGIGGVSDDNVTWYWDYKKGAA